jgi:hypothetical protein
MNRMTPKGKTIWDVITSLEGGETSEHLRLYNENPKLYNSAVMYLIMKRAPVRQYLIPKALALAYSKYDTDLTARLHQDATALDVRDATRLVAAKTYGVSLTGGRNKNRQELVRQYFRSRTSWQLQQQLLTGGKILTEIADLAHPHPRDWAGEEWLAKTAYGEQPKEGSFVEAARNFRKLVQTDVKNIKAQEEILSKYNIPWHYVKQSYGTQTIPDEAKKLLIKSFSLRGLIKEIDSFVKFEKELVEALSKDGGYLSFAVPFDAYFKATKDRHYWDNLSINIPNSVKLALLNLSSRQFEKLYFNENLSPVAIGMDVSGSMESAIEIASIVAAMLASKLNNVSMFSFGPCLTEFKVIPKNLSDVVSFIPQVHAGGYTNIADFFLQRKVIDAKTVILVSDGEENQDSHISGHRGKRVEDVLKYQNPNQRIFYLKVGSYQHSNDEVSTALKNNENWYRSTFIENISQLDAIIPMLSYNDLYGIEADLMAVAGAFVPPLDFYSNVCAACGDPVADPVNIGCEHIFHVECLKRFWDLLETNYKICPYGCKPVHRCANCNGPAAGDATECPHCGYNFALHV